MGHYRSRQSSGSSHAVQLLKEASDAIRYSVADTIYPKEPKGRTSYTSSRKKMYSPDVLKYRVHGAEGQVWTNLSSWTDGKVDAIDFGGRHRKEKKEKHQTHRSDYRHRSYSRHRHSHSHHHSHHHHHRHHHHHHHHQYQHHHHHHHYQHVDKDLDDISRNFDRAISISTPRPPPPPTPSLSASRTLAPSIDHGEIPDLPPAYSQLSSRPGSVLFRTRGVPYREATVYDVSPEDKPTPEYESFYTSTGDREVMDDMKCVRKLPVFFVPDDKVREWDWAKDEDTSYLIPEASVGTNLKQCPYLRQIHSPDQSVAY